MKPICDSLAIVTATADPNRAADCFRSWLRRSTYHLPVVVVYQPFNDEHEKNVKRLKPGKVSAGSPNVTEAVRTLLDCFAPGVHISSQRPSGVVPAFAHGVRRAFDNPDVKAVLCLHDDVLIEQDGWDAEVISYLDGRSWEGAYFGFGGGQGLGDSRLYKTDYNPMQLARQGFISNMRDAEMHGSRSVNRERVVCFDGFSAGGTRDWFERAWHVLETLGFVHHAYDSALGCYARKVGIPYGMMIPVQVHHYGGRTAVADANYAEWAAKTIEGSDHGFWEASHRILYDQFPGQLPLRLPDLERR